MVALDSAIILNPQVWVASGHVGGFSDPLVDCRTCKHRFRADHLEIEPVRPPAVEAPRRDGGLRPDRGARLQPDVRDVHRAGARGRVARLPPARDGAGDLRQLQERHVVDAREGAVRHRADRQELPQRDHARQLPLPGARVRADGDGVLRPAGGRRGVAHVLDRRARALAPRPGPAPLAPAGSRPRRRGAVALLERDERSRVPLPDRLAGARGRREPRRLRPEPALGGIRHEARVDRPRGALRPARDRAGARRRALGARVPGRRLRRGGRRRPAAHRAAAPSAHRAR